MTDILPTVEFAVWQTVKVGMLLFLVLYIIFSVVVVKQVHLMTETLKVGFEVPVKVVAYLHLAFAIAVLLITLLL